MRNTILVIRHEIYQTLRSTGYVIFAYIAPVLAALILLGIQYFSGRSGDHGGGASSTPAQFQMEIEGYVDQSGLIRTLPYKIPPGHLIRFEDEEQAQRALEAGEIAAYYVIPPDVIERGKAYYVYPDTRSYLDDGQPWVMAWTLMVNLLDGDAQLADRVWDPIWDVTLTNLLPQARVPPDGEDCSRPGASCRSNDLVRYMPSIMTAVFFVTFMTSSSRLFNSIGAEKENRVIEVMMLSVSPRQLLTGKTLGLGIASLLQAIFWLGAIYFSFNRGGSTLKLPEGFVFPLDILFLGLVFFLGGYGLFASLMAGAGALVPKMKEAGAASFIVMFPLFIGYAFGLMAPLAEAADSALLVFLSFFPLTSPVVMVMRLTNSAVPPWQLMLAVLLLFATAYYAIRTAAGMFHAQNLLSGQPFSLRRYFGIFVGR